MNTSSIAIKRFLLLCFFLISGFSNAQDGAIESKKLIDLSTESQVRKYLYSGNELRAEYKHLEKVNLYAISYWSDSLLVKGYLLEPKDSGVYPLVIFNRGGNRDYGALSPLSMCAINAGLVAEGFVVLASQYRGTQNSAGKDEFGGAEVNDINNLVKTAASLPNVDTSQMGLFGWSRGGMMSYLALKQNPVFKTIVVGNGVSDLKAELAFRPLMETRVFAECIPNYWNRKEEALRERSVIFWIDELPKSCSYLIICGSEDQVVDPANSRNLAREFERLQYSCELREFAADHQFKGKSKELDQLLIEWFSRELARKEL